MPRPVPVPWGKCRRRRRGGAAPPSAPDTIRAPRSCPDAPHLAGQPAIYLATQLRAYRSGARRHEVMNVMAKPLSDEDIVHLAAWFSSIRVEAVLPP